MTDTTEPVLVRRVRIANAVRLRYFGQPLTHDGCDCRAMLREAAQLADRNLPLLRNARFTTLEGGRKWMKRHQLSSLVEAIDRTGLTRIAPARLLPADFIALPAPENDLLGGALAMWLGDGQALGWGEGEALAGIMEPHTILAAWRLLDG